MTRIGPGSLRAGAAARLFLAALGAGCFATGCDYWRNLVGEKSVTRVRLAVEVRDAWTGEPLANVYDPGCEDSARGLKLAIRDGRAVIPEAATGKYLLTCGTGPGAGPYYPQRKSFEVGRDGATLVVDLARRGGPDWYPEESEKQVRFQRDSVLIFPGKPSIAANPHDSSGAFAYLWTFSSNPGLNRGPISTRINKPYYSQKIGALDVAAGPDTLTLSVKSYLGGHDTGYAVGGYSMPFRWVRNLPPEIEASLNSLTFRLGCGENLNRPRINFRARDPDAGKCDSVVFASNDANVVFTEKGSSPSPELLRLVKTCTDTNNPVLVRLKNPFTDASPARVTNRISVTAWDGNGEYTDTVLEFSSDNNAPPSVNISKIGARSTFFPFPEILFKIDVADDFGGSKEITVDWGDGTLARPVFPQNQLVYSFDLKHTFQDLGRKTVTAYVTDACDTVVSATVQELIYIMPNSLPTFSIDRKESVPVADSGVRWSFKLSIADADTESGLDSLTKVWVDWGDGGVDSLTRNLPRPYTDQHWQHAYPYPASGSRIYKVTVRAEDANRGFADTTLNLEVSRPQ